MQEHAYDGYYKGPIGKPALEIVEPVNFSIHLDTGIKCLDWHERREKGTELQYTLRTDLMHVFIASFTRNLEPNEKKNTFCMPQTRIGRCCERPHILSWLPSGKGLRRPFRIGKELPEISIYGACPCRHAAKGVSLKNGVEIHSNFTPTRPKSSKSSSICSDSNGSRSPMPTWREVG